MGNKDTAKDKVDQENPDKTPGDKGKGSRTVAKDSDVAKQIEKTHGFAAAAEKQKSQKGDNK